MNGQTPLEKARAALKAKREAGLVVNKPRKKREKKPVVEPFHKGRFLLDEDDRLTVFAAAEGDDGVELEPEATARLRAFLAQNRPE